MILIFTKFRPTLYPNHSPGNLPSSQGNRSQLQYRRDGFSDSNIKPKQLENMKSTIYGKKMEATKASGGVSTRGGEENKGRKPITE